MKLNKVFSLLLTIVLMLNTICVVTAFAEDAQITISGAVTEVQIGTVANGKTPAIATNVTQNGHSVLMNTNGNYASFTVYSPVEAAYKLSLCYGGEINTNDNIYYSVFVGTDEMISSDTLKATGNADSATWTTVKSVKLKSGINTLKFERKSGGASFKFVGFKLETAGIDNVVEIGTGTMTISSDSTASGTKGSISATNGKFFGLPVNVMDAGSYKLYANITSTSASTASVKANSGEAKAVSIAGAGYAELGIFELSQGLNTINFENTGNNEIKVTGLKLEYTTVSADDIIQSEVNDILVGEAINNGKDDGHLYMPATKYDTSTGANNYSYYFNETGDGVEFTINTSKTAVYNLYVNYSSSVVSGNAYLNVYVNGTTSDYKVIDMAKLPCNGDINKTLWSEKVGSIKLIDGENTLRFEAASATELKFAGFRLETVSEDNAVEFVTGRFTTGATGNRTNIDFTSSNPFTFPINALSAGNYMMSLYCDAVSGAKVSVSLNGTQIIKDKVITLQEAGYADIGTVTLEPGENVLSFTNLGSTVKIYNLKFNKNNKIYEIESAIALKNIKTYGQMTIRSYADTDDVLWFMVAKYTNNNGNKQMKECKIKKITFNSDDGEIKTTERFNLAEANTGYTIDSNSFNTSDIVAGEVIKVFLLDSETFTPLLESVEYTYTEADYNQSHPNN